METNSVIRDDRAAGAPGTEQVTMTNGKQKYLLSEDSFTLLRQAQKCITEATDLAPSFRKMINALITQETITQLTEKFIDELH